MPYELFSHRHNFAVWAAARAAQRNFTTTQNLRRALEACGVPGFVCEPEFLNTPAQRFEELHRKWCSAVCEFLGECGVANTTYGRAAKLIAVYLKCMVVIGGEGYSPLGRVVHPPIDRILLQNLAGAPEVNSPHKPRWRKTNWTQLDSDQYYTLVSELRAALPAEQPFWMLEQYWTLRDE